MTEAMRHVIQNVPVTESHGRYVVSARWGSGAPVMSIRRAEAGHGEVLLCVCYGRQCATVVPSLCMAPEDDLYQLVVRLLRDHGEWSEHHRQFTFESDRSMTEALDRLLERLEDE